MTETIAIVGIGCCYPDAGTPRALWENLLAGRRSFRRIPPERLNLGDYFSADPATPDAIYAREAALIEGYEFDRPRFRVAGPTYRGADLVHWLALDVADRALRDAGFPDGEGLPRETTGVLLGNTLTGEFSRAALMRLRWPYVRRVADAELRGQHWPAEQRRIFLDRMETLYKAPFEPVGEETLAGGLANTIAGRICNHYHLQGGGYTLDGACSSSLLAVANACTALAAGDLDVALAGGVDLSLDPFELIGFAKTGALAKGEMRVYDRDSQGFLPGEGCGCVVLMRYGDALAAGARCYAVIRGWGISSDGGGGITRPERAGQILALERAYRKAGYGPDTVALFEGHGTGTAVGDEVELRALAEVRRRGRGTARPAVVGSIKANIGHTKAAAGVAGLLKASLALHAQVLPPGTGTREPHPVLREHPSLLRVPETAEPWPADAELRAGVSAFGFGGINAHIALEGPAAVRRGTLTLRETRLAGSPQDAELFLLAADSREALLAEAARLAELALRLSHAELADLAAHLARRLPRGEVRGAVVAGTPSELAGALEDLRDRLAAGETRSVDASAGVFLGTGTEPPRLGLLFPGQAAPVRWRGGALARRYPSIRALYRRAELDETANPADSRWAQPAIIAAELAGLEILERLGLRARLALGHSLGELAALHWAGALDREALLRLAHRRGEATTDPALPPGAMASLGLPAAEVAAWLRDEAEAVIAGYNGEHQTVVSGAADAVARLVEKARARNAAAVPLPVSRAFHSPRMGAAAAALAGHLAAETFAPVERTVISTVTGRPVSADADLPNLLVRQLTEPVRFTEALARAAAEVDLFVECGPGRILSGLSRETGVPALSLDSAGESWRGLLGVLGAAHALGSSIAAEALFAERCVRPFDPEREARFFVNPCELAPPLEDRPEARPLADPAPRPAMAEPARPAPAETETGSGPDRALEVVRKLVAQRAELPPSTVEDRHRLLRDLHLNSISVGQLVAEAARQLGLPPPLAPAEYADATVAGLAEALEALRGTLPEAAEPEGPPPGLEPWVRAFRMERREVPLPAGGPFRREAPAARETGHWRIFGHGPDSGAAVVASALRARPGAGVLVWLDGSGDEVPGALLLEAAQAALALPERSAFVLVQRHGIASAFARTLHLEAPELQVCVVDTPFDAGVPERVLAELRHVRGYAEAFYDGDGRRFEQRLRPEFGAEDGPLPLGPEDVLLVSGGGKGIAAECALALAVATGARTILLGRSRPETDEELAANLRRFEAAGVACRYVPADVTEVETVREGLAAAQAELGAVTALLHGAGLNRPKLIRELRAEDMAGTLAPKLDGLRNLLAAVDSGRLRLLAAFGSIIGRTGLRGEADYALANAALRRRVEVFAADHPACLCRVLEWSVWSGVGMGERLGRIDALLRSGISPITPDQGVDWMLRALRLAVPDLSLVIGGRLGAEPAIPLEGAAVPFQRFLETVRVFYPGVELVAEAELSVDTDPYLDDHVVRGERLLPAVLGLEAMAQAARAVLGESRLPVFERVRFDRPIVVEPGSRLTLRILALARAPGLVEVALRNSGTGFQADDFRALCRFEAEAAGAGPVPDEDESAGGETAKEAQGWYGSLFFHRGRFRRVTAYREVRARHCRADIAGDAETAWFGRYLPGALVLGDPGARDAFIHAIQACIPHGLLLPVGIGRLVFGAVDGTGPWTLRARERRREGDLFVYDLEAVGADGRFRERWEGLRLRRVADRPWRAWPEALLAPYLERRIGELLPEGGLASLVLRRDGGEAGHRASDPALLHALGREARIQRRPDGKPELPGGPALSAAHAGHLTLAVAGAAPLACDLEAVAERGEAAWRDLLGAEGFGLAGFIAKTSGEPLAGAATRVWTALECLKKAGLPWNAGLVFEAMEPDGWIVLGAGAVAVATGLARLEDGTGLGVAVLARRSEPAMPPVPKASNG